MHNWQSRTTPADSPALQIKAPQGIYTFECWRRKVGCQCSGCLTWEAVQAGVMQWSEELQPSLKCVNEFLAWSESIHNTVFDAGINDMLDKYFKGSSYSATWFVLLVDNASFSAYAAADTAATHSGWSESTAYSNSTRPSLTLGSVASKSVDNSASKASFTINATATIRGAGISTNSTKGGTTGILYGAADFVSSRAVISGDTLNVQVTLTGA